jgi:hypothetical protein
MKLFVGEWNVEIVHPQLPSPITGHQRFEPILGGRFLLPNGDDPQWTVGSLKWVVPARPGEHMFDVGVGSRAWTLQDRNGTPTGT